MNNLSACVYPLAVVTNSLFSKVMSLNNSGDEQYIVLGYAP